MANTVPNPDSRIHLLLLNEFFYPENQGGTGTATSDLVSRLVRDHPVRVTAITSRFAYRDANVLYPARDKWGETEIYRVASPNWSRKKTSTRFIGNLLFAYSTAVRALTLPRADVVLVTTAPLTLPIAARILLRLRGIPYVYLIYDLDPDRTVALNVKPEGSRSVKLLRSWQKAWLNSSFAVVAIGRCMRDHIQRVYDLPKEKIAIVEVGADPNVVKPMTKDTAFRKEKNLEGRVILYSGNFGQYHDFDTLLGAAERMKDKPGLTFVLVGGGAKKAYIETQIKERNLTNVRLYPFVPEEALSDMMASADAHVVTLEPGMEGLCVPSKFYTCLASGRPVIALMSAKTEVGYAVEESNVGFRVDIGDVDQLTKILSERLDDTEEQGKRARDVFERLYTADRVADKLFDVLRKAANRPASQSRNTADSELVGKR